MNSLQSRLTDTLQHATERLRKGGLPSQVTMQMNRLIEKASERCVVAIVGRVKAGKSTFVNALLGEDLAKTGVNETTATINYFRGGDPHLPIRCHWHDGKVTEVDRQFVDRLQSNDEETLRQANGIDYLEYFVLNDYLEKITLVDTPGISSVIDAHQNRVASWLNLQNQLRERHHRDTQNIGSQADAVIYLTGETARTDAQSFLEEFKHVTQGNSRSFNAIGVMAQIDLNDEVISRREELSKKTASQLQAGLNTVIPVSAGIQLALDGLLAQDRAGLKQMMSILRPTPGQVRISPTELNDLLADPSLYLETESALSTTERKQLRGKMLWRAFVIVVGIVADTSLDEDAIVEKLQEIAGFKKLRKVLEQQFIERSILLHSYSIVSAALQIIEDIRYSYLREFLRYQAENDIRRQRFLSFLKQVRYTSPSPVISELEAFIQERLAPGIDLNIIIDEVQREISKLKYELEDYDMDFVAMQQLESSLDSFTPEELDELRPLFGLYDLAIEARLLPQYRNLSYLGQRLNYWSWKTSTGRSSVVISVAQQAERRYGMLIETLGQ